MVSAAFVAPLMAEDPDEDILQLTAAGKRDEAIRLLMKRHGEGLYRYVTVALRGRGNADDVHQRVFIEADRDLRRFARRSTLRTWLFGIARHRVLDAIKADKRHERVEPIDELELPEDSPAPPEQLDDVRLQQVLAMCLDRLGDHVRVAVLLRYQQGFSYEDMARVCNEKAGTLQARVTRALPALRECIERRTKHAV